MKKFMKALIVAVCAALLVVGSIAGTIAYLTATDTVTNTFTVGKVAITLDEAKVTVYGEQDGDTRVDANEYKLVPSRTYMKDPTIHVDAESEECYVFFKLDNQLGDAVTFNISSADWTEIGDTDVYYYKEAATAGGNYTAFTEFTVKNDANVSALGEKTVNVTAYAVQTSTNFADAEAAWNATFGATVQP